MKRSDCVRCRCTVDLGRQNLRESSRTNENGNSARAVSISSSTGLRSTSGALWWLASFQPENSALRVYFATVDYAIASFSSMRTRSSWTVSRAIPFIRREDDWLLVDQATDSKRPSLTSSFPEKGTGKKLWTVYQVLTTANPLRVALHCSLRGHATQPLSWRAVLHLMWDTSYEVCARSVICWIIYCVSNCPICSSIYKVQLS
jgi:hypothetical protein